MSIKLTIPEPCHENWQQMQPDKDGRHCLSCQKTVVDFSLMTDKEILDYISRAGNHLCGRFDQHQLNRSLQEHRTRSRFSWAYAWALAAVGFFLGEKAKAQGGIKAVKVEKVPDKWPKEVGMIAFRTELMPVAHVIDEVTMMPVPFASVLSKKGKTAIADSSGKFSLELFKGGRQTITVSAIGYAAQELKLEKHYAGSITIYLKPEAQELKPVEVSAISGSVRCEYVTGSVTSYMGTVITGVRISSTEKFKRVVHEWFPKKDIITYPNPISPGSTMKVDLQLKESGQYRLELIDATGKIRWIQSMNIPTKQFNLSVPTQPTWSAGVYWLRISGTHTKNVYNSRVVIQ